MTVRTTPHGQISRLHEEVTAKCSATRMWLWPIGWGYRRSAPSGVQRHAAHIEKVGDVLAGFALLDQLAGVADLRGRQFGFAPESRRLGAARPSRRRGCAPRSDKLGQYTDHLPHCATRGRVGVDRLSDRLESDAAVAELVQHRYQIAQAAAQTAEFPHNEGTARPQRFQTTCKLGAVGRRTAATFVLEDMGNTGSAPE